MATKRPQNKHLLFLIDYIKTKDIDTSLNNVDLELNTFNQFCKRNKDYNLLFESIKRNNVSKKEIKNNIKIKLYTMAMNGNIKALFRLADHFDIYTDESDLNGILSIKQSNTNIVAQPQKETVTDTSIDDLNDMYFFETE